MSVDRNLDPFLTPESFDRSVGRRSFQRSVAVSRKVVGVNPTRFLNVVVK